MTTPKQAINIKLEQLYQVPDQPTFSSEASELGLDPGEWPELIYVQEWDSFFIRKQALRDGGEFYGYRYFSQDGKFQLTVFND